MFNNPKILSIGSYVYDYVGSHKSYPYETRLLYVDENNNYIMLIYDENINALETRVPTERYVRYLRKYIFKF